MSSFVATIIDTSGIQPYIFGSNRLRENIGASQLVSEATDLWVKKALCTLSKNLQGEGKPNSKVHAQISDPVAKPYIENSDDRLAAELLYTGGGNAIVLFQTLEYAIEFTKILTLRVLQEAPGLTLLVAHQEFDWEDSLFEILRELRLKLERQKQQQIPSAPLLGLGVTVDCLSTRLAAIDMSDRYGIPKDSTYPISREVREKLRAVERANDRLTKLISEANQHYEFPRDVDDMGRSEKESSYIAVVHADGNGMGNRFQNYGKDKANRDYITEMRKLSQSINNAGLTALKSVIKKLTQSIQAGEVVGSSGRFSLKENYLPFRPLVYGGDDVTFICDGRLGLELAAHFLESFEQQLLPDEKPLTACAGICIVKTHYPFARAYDLSEALCRQAKRYVREESETGFSALDWHIASSGLLGSIAEIRKREYQVKAGSLTVRPIALDRTREWRTWSSFSQVVRAFQAEEWRDRKNKVMALREVLRQGKDAVKQFLSAYDLPKLPEFINAEDSLAETGWLNQKCGYFDAIEAMEFYLGIQSNCEEQSDEHL
ncbi:Cas10/Cmr2 second palm domain-containing protein [Leptolyngbya sp. AN03gr2]|uniref:Cas10/Cmr2 second palm domain-containing protein n=1 Tax=unclassified Leptolyngbya TaxID=2650499 RepID=UPI003D316561